MALSQAHADALSPAHGHHEHLGFLSETPSQGSPLGLDPSPPVNSQSQPWMDPGLHVTVSGRFLEVPSLQGVRAARCHPCSTTLSSAPNRTPKPARRVYLDGSLLA